MNKVITVKDLIKELEKMDQDAKCYVYGENDFGAAINEVTAISEEKHKNKKIIVIG